MVLDTLYDPDDLLQLRDRDVAVLSGVIRKELLTNPAIQKALATQLARYTKAIGVQLRTKTQ
jgi:hypothetical protein